MLAGLFLGALIFFSICYRIYGRFLERTFGVDYKRRTPAEAMYDGVDYCPAHPSVLLGHHFSSIAGAGPIVGPITAALWFGWLPAYIWCLIGSAFFGGPHDMGSLAASIRHEGKSMGEVVRRWIGERGRTLFQWFTVLTLVLIVAVFLQMAAATMAGSPIVAFAATVYMAAAVLFGLLVYRLKLPLVLITIIMLPVVFGACWFAYTFPAVAAVFTFSVETWRWILVAYIVLASLFPVWLLLQPRDYLASFFLYFAVIIGAIGMLFGSFLGEAPLEVTLPAFSGLVSSKGHWLWPMLFVTVACGAISGFHSMVGSGTTSKQLRSEKDVRPIGYGSMLLEGMIAVIALGTVMVAGASAVGTPMQVFSSGFGSFAALVGINPVLGAAMGALAINSFVLTTLDTATRLTRYQIQELSGNRLNKCVATVVAVAGALSLLLFKSGESSLSDIIWPVFGSANQLVAALALLALAVWVARSQKKDNRFLMYPMWFMLATTIAALIQLFYSQVTAPATNWVVVIFDVVLIVLAVLMVREALTALNTKNTMKAAR